MITTLSLNNRHLSKLHKKFMFDNDWSLNNRQLPKRHKKFMFDNDHNLEPE